MKILCLPFDEENGCYHYRVKQPLEMLESLGHEVFRTAGKNEADIIAATKNADAVFLNNSGGKNFSRYLMRLKKYVNLARIKEGKPELKFIVDFDDNFTAINPYSDSYRHGGIEEVTIDFQGKTHKLWEDGKSGFNIGRNKMNRAWTLWVVANAHMITTTTPVIAGFYDNLNDNVEILGNAIDFKRFKHELKPKRNPREIRIGWHGGASHHIDFLTIQTPLNMILRKYPNVKLVFFGHIFGRELFPPDQVEFHEWAPLEAYPLKLASLGLDIGIVPLHANDFNACKSPLKWEEYSALKIPCVVANTEPYNLYCRHMETALLYETEQLFYRNVQTLIHDMHLREKIAEQAYWDVLKNFSMPAMAKDYERAFEKALRIGIEKEAAV